LAHRWLVYNLSPSFNWGAHGISEDKLKSFIWDLGEAGFVFQLISLAGLHTGATITCAFSYRRSYRRTMVMRRTDELAKRYKTDGMLAYVELVQRREKELGVDVLTHQKWSGASYVDRILQCASVFAWSPRK
jgi:isocitrate lyase